MIFNGFNKTDLVNFPSNIAATVFVRGCNFRCPYCHNVSLVNPNEYSEEEYSEEEIFEYLLSRKSFIDGVVVTGGEPTLYKEIPDFIRRVNDMGFMVKLDTNGTNPDMIKYLIDNELIDYLAMDIKAPLNKYEPFVGGMFLDVESLLRKTISLLRNSSVQYEFRTTCPKGILSLQDFDAIAAELNEDEKWYLQEFNPHVTLDASFANEVSYTKEELESIALKYKMAKVRG